MRTWSLLLIVVLVLGALAALVGFGVFDPDPSQDRSGESGGERSADPDSDAEDAELIQLYGPAPEGEPVIPSVSVDEDLGVLLLVGAPQRFNHFLALQWGQLHSVRLRSWAAPLPREPAGTGLIARPLAGALPSAPRAGFLADEDIDVLVLHDIDPKAIEDEFWLDVAQRVEEGRLGLLVLPDFLHGRALFEHPMLGPLLPVAGIKKIEGQPAPGLFGRVVPFQITTDGERHPASRLVPWPRWSRALWNSRREGEAAWGTRFCMPVDALAADAQVLLQADPPRGDGWPALIAGAPAKGRVLWFGARELGVEDTYGRPSVVRDWDALVTSWLAWLGGRITK